MIWWDRALTVGTLVPFGRITTAAQSGYGLGWRTMTREGRRVVEHDGDGIGTRTYFVRYLDVQLSIIILSNQTRFEVEELAHELARRFAQ
jgi:hypothetical protein